MNVMVKMDAVEMLDKLADFRSQRDLIRLQESEAMDAAFPEELRQTLKDIEAEFAGRSEIVNEKIASLEKEIKAEVLEHGETIKGTHLMAVWNKGRVSWNSKALEGYAVAHPEVAAFRKEGKPSISIRG